MSVDLLEGLEYVKDATYSQKPTLNSVIWFDITKNNVSTVLMGSRLKSSAYVALMTDDYILNYNGKAFTLSSMSDNIELDQISDINITEEWFFQLSCSKNFSSLTYQEIKFLKDVLERHSVGNINV